MAETPVQPDGCRLCGLPRPHGWQYLPDVGQHQWEAPTDAQRLERMKARRAERLQPKTVAPVPDDCVVTLAADAGPAVRAIQDVQAAGMFATHPDLRGGA